MTEIMGLLTIARKASKLALGMDMTKDACKSGAAKCVLVASDLSQKSLKEIKFFCEQLGKKVGIIAVLDSGFYKKARTLLNEIKADGITY